MAYNVTQYTNELNDDLEKISNWAYQWKTSFNPDKSKQTQEIIFCHKTQRVIHPDNQAFIQAVLLMSAFK